ncbi:MAG: hypothetical protein HKL96_01125 [Phycisphaerales bacterium]|nr:hypothetical protein [Phycisphaerales bacterium]
MNHSVSGPRHGLTRAVLVAMGILALAGCRSRSPQTIAPASPVQTTSVVGLPDNQTLLNNPAMGWVFYQNPLWPHPELVWRRLAAEWHVSNIVYWRGPWSDFEPQPGRYVWRYNPRVITWIRKVRAAHKRLAFRVLVNSKDRRTPATPLWVKAQGARGYDIAGVWTPYPDDPVFQRDFSRFIRAFGKRFDNPRETDFVDAAGLGWWGEMHHLKIPASHFDQVYNWLCGAYAKAFPHVLLVTNFGPDVGLKMNIRIALDKYGILFRRDGLGSLWINARQKQFMRNMFPRSPLFGELCYGYRGPGKPIDANPHIDQRLSQHGIHNFSEDLEWAMKQALEYHANTLNISWSAWFKLEPNLVQKFISRGGYRLYPAKLKFPAEMQRGQPCSIEQTWCNAGVGVLPNATPQWNHKYKFAFALFKKDAARPVAVAVDPSAAHLSTLIKGRPLNRTSVVHWSAAPGEYKLAVAIVDTTEHDRAAIELAVRNLPRIGRWYVIGNTHVSRN